jgi:hypothetical protein
MNKQQVLDFWIIFFKDLLVGTFKKLFLFGILGFLSGALGIYVFNFQVLDTAKKCVKLYQGFRSYLTG